MFGLSNRLLLYFVLYRDLDIASMKAVALLLDGLPLQPPESSERNGSDEKGNLFYKCVDH